MRFHIRRLALLALSSTFATLILLNTLRPSHDVDPAVQPPVQVELRPQRPVSLNERLARYSGGANVTGTEQPAGQYVAPFSVVKRRPLQPQSPKTNVDSLKDKLMSENVAGSLNEQMRREFVHLPSLEHAVETLWWSSSTDHPTDRILAQMRHVPTNYQRDQQTPLKTIYMPGGLGNEPEGQEKFISEQCPVNACRLTADHSVALTAEMRLLQNDASFEFTQKPAGQIWTMFLLESPANTGVFRHAQDLINWTATYRADSTIVTPYEKFVPYDQNETLQDHGLRMMKRRRRTTSTATTERKITTRNYAAGKTKMVAWFVSNCGPKNKRNEYAEELAK